MKFYPTHLACAPFAGFQTVNKLVRALALTGFLGLGALCSTAAASGLVPNNKSIGKIWFIGDSITQSNADGDPTGSPRKSLYDLLIANSYTFKYTGHFTDNIDGLPGSPDGLQDYVFHSGLSGSLIGNSNSGRQGMTALVTERWALQFGYLFLNKPNVVLIMLGTNDIDAFGEPGIPATADAPARMTTLINTVYGLSGIGTPTVFIATIAPNTITPTKTANVIAYNAALPAVVSAQVALGRDVHLVDHYTPLNNAIATSMMPDNLHPNATGNGIIAQQWYNAINAIAGSPATIPAAPSGLTATANSSSQITLNWTDNSSNETGFRVERSPNGSSNWTQIATPSANATSYADTGLTASTTYHYRVRSTNTAGDSANTSVANATTSAPAAPAAPSGLTATANSSSQITLNWTDNSSNETGFKVERSANGSSDWSQIATPSANATNFANTGLTAVTTYHYRLRATNATGDSAYSNTANATTTTAPVGNLIAYDGFAGGTVFNGGTGWSGSWSAGINAGANLTFGNLNTTGVGANINGYWNSTSIRSLSTPVTSGTVWFSWVQNGGSAASEFKQIRIMNGANEVLVVGQHNDANTFKLYNGNGDYTARANTATAITGTHFVVLSINLSNSTFNLYIDPTGLGTGAAPSSVVSATFSRGGSISSITGLQSVGGGDTFAWDEVRVGTTWSDVSPVPVAPLTGVQAFRTTYGLATNGSQDLLIPAGDGVANLLKYAFNMLGAGQAYALTTPNASILTANGSAGLPLVDADGTGKLRVTYVSRKSTSNSGISYFVEFSDTLANGTWAVNALATTAVTSIDATFERVVVTDANALTKRFVRVRVTTP